MRNTIGNRLVPLASLAAQHRYTIGGTPETHLIPDELLEDIYEVIRMVREMEPVRDSLSPDAIQLILDAEPYADAVARTMVALDSDVEELVERSGPWRALRDHTRACLDAIEFDLSAWEEEYAAGAPGHHDA